MQTKKEREAYKLYDEMLDEYTETIRILSFEYSPSFVLKNIDEIAYEDGFRNFCDAQNINLDEDKET